MSLGGTGVKRKEDQGPPKPLLRSKELFTQMEGTCYFTRKGCRSLSYLYPCPSCNYLCLTACSVALLDFCCNSLRWVGDRGDLTLQWGEQKNTYINGTSAVVFFRSSHLSKFCHVVVSPLSFCFSQAEQSIADLTMAQNKLKAEAADLRDVTAKMSALNESLALDKVDLNQLLLKVRPFPKKYFC